MNINFGLRDAVYLGKVEGEHIDYAGVFLVKQNPFQELITNFLWSNGGSLAPHTAELADDIQSPIVTIFGKSSNEYNTVSLYNSSLKTACSSSNFVITDGDYDTYYTPTAREKFLQNICVAGVWDDYGIKEAVINAKPSFEYTGAEGLAVFNNNSALYYMYKGYLESIHSQFVLERLYNFVLSVYGVAVINNSVYDYVYNELGYNIIVVPVIKNDVTIPSGLLESIAANITTDADKQQEIAEILCSAYNTVSCMSPVFRGVAAVGDFPSSWNMPLPGTDSFVSATPIFNINVQISVQSFTTKLHFIDRTQGCIPEGYINSSSITIQNISDFNTVISDYISQDKVSEYTVVVHTYFGDLNDIYTYRLVRDSGSREPFTAADGDYDTRAIFYVCSHAETHNLILGYNGIIDGSHHGSSPSRFTYNYWADAQLQQVSDIILNAINTRAGVASADKGVRCSNVTVYDVDYDRGKKWEVAGIVYNCINFTNMTTHYFFTIGMISKNGDIMRRDVTELGTTYSNRMLFLSIKQHASNGPDIYVADSVLEYVGEQSIPAGAVYPDLSADYTFGNGFLYADLVIPSNKPDVKQLNIYNKDSYNLHYIIAKENKLVLFDPTDLFVYPKNVSTSISAKYEVYACTRSPLITKLNSKVYLDSAISNNGEIDIRAAASDSSDTNTTALAYTTLVGTPFTELSISSVLVSLLMYTGYIDHAFYETNLVTLIDGIYTTVSSLIGQYYYVCVCFPGTTDVCILKVDSQTSTTDGKTGYKVTICNSTDIASLFINQEAIPALNNSSATCKFVEGNPVIDVDGYRLVIDTQFTNGQNYYMFTLNSDTGDTSEFALALSTKLTYLCNCKIPVLYIDNVNTSIINITDGIVTFMINDVAVTLNSNTGMLYYSDDVFELDCSIDEVSGVFEYMKYCTISSVFYGVYKVTSADSNLYTVTSDGIILGDLDFSVEEIDE